MKAIFGLMLAASLGWTILTSCSDDSDSCPGGTCAGSNVCQTACNKAKACVAAVDCTKAPDPAQQSACEGQKATYDPIDCKSFTDAVCTGTVKEGFEKYTTCEINQFCSCKETE